MAVFQCKMCGGALKIHNHESIVTCEYCDTTQTLPNLDDDRIAVLYERASHFRRNNEFDKAMSIYEQILNLDHTDAEAYWSLVLCRYGIEYVADPRTQKRIPTVNRVQYTSVFDDDNFRSAIKYADPGQRNIYAEEAKTINEIQKNYLAISQREDPFDVFICYKETDTNGRRTLDSVLAQDLYDQLTKKENLKVFFSRITLEDKLGTAYEPYIFSALNSAKVMIVLGTDPNNFNAVWVRNEWSRYLSLINHGEDKILIPAYKDMSPYDLPSEFSHLQAQDMSKIGFMQDLVRGIRKIVAVDEKNADAITSATNQKTTAAALIKRAFIFAEDTEWSSAAEYCEKALDLDPENAEAYLCKMMVQFHVRTENDLSKLLTPIDNNENYRKVMRYGDDILRKRIQAYNQQIIYCINYRAKDAKYAPALSAFNTAKTYKEYEELHTVFLALGEHRNSQDLARICEQKALSGRQCYKETSKYNLLLAFASFVVILVAAALGSVISGIVFTFEQNSNILAGLLIGALSLAILTIMLSPLQTISTFLAGLFNIIHKPSAGIALKTSAIIIGLIGLLKNIVFTFAAISNLKNSIQDGTAYMTISLICIIFVNIIQLIFSILIKRTKKIK